MTKFYIIWVVAVVHVFGTFFWIYKDGPPGREEFMAKMRQEIRESEAQNVKDEHPHQRRPR